MNTIPDGWQLVPIEPTEAMLSAQYDGESGYDERARSAWREFLATAPSPPTDHEIETGKQYQGVPGATYRLLSRFDWRETTQWARGEMLRRTEPAVVFDVAAGCIASVCLQVVGLFGRTQIREAAQAIMTKAAFILEEDIQKVIESKKETTVLHNRIRLVSDT